MSKCTVCKNEVDWDYITESFEDVFEQADVYGMEPLTEHEQVLVEGKICSFECFDELSNT